MAPVSASFLNLDFSIGSLSRELEVWAGDVLQQK
jgi:hypothetical protein